MNKALVHAATGAALAFCLAVTFGPVRAEDFLGRPGPHVSSQLPDWPSVKVTDEAQPWKPMPPLKLVTGTEAKGSPAGMLSADSQATAKPADNPLYPMAAARQPG